MSNIVKINGTELTVIEFQGQRVATLAQVDEVHDRPEGTARRTFNEHKHRLVEGEDFFELDQPDVIRTLGFERPQGGTPSKVILITEQGYTMLVKPFSDDLAWQVQRQVVTGYFRAKDALAANTKPARVSERYREAAAIAQASIKLCKLMGMEQNMARVITADVVRKEAGIDCLPMLAGNIAVKEAPVTPTKLGELLEPPLSAARVNLLLIEVGLQTRDAEKNYHLTEAGKEFGALEPFSSRTSKHVGHRVMWYERALEPLKQQMAKQSNVIPLQSAL